MTLHINRQLNLVVPIDQDHGTLYVFSMPIPRAVFEANFRIFSKTFALLYSEGGAITGPRLAAMYMRVVGEDMGLPNQVEAIFNEIRRLTNVLMPTPSGWATKPWDDVVRESLINEDDESEVLNSLAFFTLASHMHKKTDLEEVLSGVSKLWGAQVTSLTLLEYRNSLPTSTPAEPIPMRAQRSSIPS